MKASSKWIAVGLVFTGIVLLTVIGGRVPGQLDLTDARLYTLSPSSRDLVPNLEEPVELRFYFSRSIEGLPIDFKNFATRVEDLLRQYQRAGGGNVRLVTIDPRPDTDDEQEAIRSGLHNQPLPTGENLFFGLQVRQADSTAVIPFFDRNREPFLEYDISQLLFQVQQLDQPRVGILSPLELGPPPVEPRHPRAPRDNGAPAFVEELRATYDVEILDPEDEALPSGLDVLLVIHPQNFADKLLFEIDQFALSGRPLLVALDPSSHIQSAERMQAGMMGMQQQMPDVSSDLGPIPAAWGVDYDPATVVGDRRRAAGVTVKQGAPPVRYPVWLNFEGIESDSPVLATLSNLLIVEPGSFALREDAPAGVEWTPLLESSEESGPVPTAMLAFPSPENVSRSLEPDGERRVLAAILRGALPTAFAEGRPTEDGEDNDAEANAPDFLAESRRPSTVVFLGDTDFLNNQFSVREMNIFGMRAVQPINDNIAFFVNLVDSLAGNPDLIALRGKGTSHRPFTVVQDLERRAQADYEQQLAHLEERLAEVRARLAELQRQAPDQQQLIASPETQEAIERFRLEEAEVRAQQREIRKKLREEIEALNLRLALFNLLTMPVLVALGGIVFFVRRNRKRS
ncbi:MAG: Gldg family protein [Opitutales bacterium]|nr:Gldg family protein [Opitutales bacterium]